MRLRVLLFKEIVLKLGAQMNLPQAGSEVIQEFIRQLGEIARTIRRFLSYSPMSY